MGCFRNWKNSVLLLGVLLLTGAHTQFISSDGCLEFSAGVCIRCSEDTHFYLNYCYQNILGCKKYLNGSICVECDESISRLTGATCTLLEGQGPSIEIAKQLYKYGNPGDRYGGNNYIPISYNEVRAYPTFIAMDSFLRRGQWGHFISKSANPVYSVHYRTREEIVNGINTISYGYKTLYEGTGGGLFLCIAQVPYNFLVRIYSLTVIQLAQIVDNCIDYQVSTTKCIRCGTGYHLEGDNCYQNYGGCIKYLQNICLECNEYYLLLENRCVSDCVSISDARSILFYEASNTSTLVSRYSVSLDTFYQITTTTTTITTTTTTVTTAQTQNGAIVIVPLSNQTTTESVTFFSRNS